MCIFVYKIKKKNNFQSNYASLIVCVSNLTRIKTTYVYEFQCSAINLFRQTLRRNKMVFITILQQGKPNASVLSECRYCDLSLASVYRLLLADCNTLQVGNLHLIYILSDLFFLFSLMTYFPLS